MVCHGSVDSTVPFKGNLELWKENGGRVNNTEAAYQPQVLREFWRATSPFVLSIVSFGTKYVYIINTIYTSTYIFIYMFLAIQLQIECNYIINLENNISWYSFELQFAPYNIVIPAYRSPKKKTWGSDCCLQDFKAPEISKAPSSEPWKTPGFLGYIGDYTTQLLGD